MYLLLFVLCPLLLWESRKKEGIASIALVIAALALPCAFAGFRASSVGTDMLVYGEWGFELSKIASWQEYYSQFAGWHPLGYLLLTWIVGHFTKSWLLFFALIQALTIIPIYYLLNKKCNGYEWLGMLVYLLLVFPLSLNAMKQMIACSFAAVSICYALENKRISCLIWMVLAALFHKTALFIIVFLPFLVYVNKGKYIQVAFVSIGLFVVAVLLAPQVLPILAKIQPTFAYALEHMSGGSSNRTVLVLALICLMVHLYAIWCGGFSFKSGQDDPVAYLALFLLGVLILQFDAVATSVGRLGYYGYVFSVIWLPSLYKAKENSLGVVRYVPVAGFIIYFIYIFVVNHVGEIYPYQSSILGIG